MTALSIRITTATRKQLETTLRRAFQAGDLPLVKRVTALLGIPSFVRHVVLDRWFLHAHDPALNLS